MSTKPESWDEVCAHLRSCEEGLLDPAVRRDRGQVDALLAQDFLEFGSSGRVWTREHILELLATEVYEQPSMEEFECARISEGVALVTYRTVRSNPNSAERSASLRSSLWTKCFGGVAGAIPPGNTRSKCLSMAPAEKIVLFSTGAIRTPQAAD